jgi:hypothetical protein
MEKIKITENNITQSNQVSALQHIENQIHKLIGVFQKSDFQYYLCMSILSDLKQNQSFVISIENQIKQLISEYDFLNINSHTIAISKNNLYEYIIYSYNHTDNSYTHLYMIQISINKYNNYFLSFIKYPDLTGEHYNIR